MKKNENDAFRFSRALNTQEGFLEAPLRNRFKLWRYCVKQSEAISSYLANCDCLTTFAITKLESH